MNVFDIIGPVMIGPSSSHTAGAARLGLVARSMLGAPAASAEIRLHGSFAKTYRGHGTDKALIAGILGMKPDDARLRDSLKIAEQQGLSVTIIPTVIENAHPNTALISLKDANGNTASIQGASVGGGNILVTKVNGMDVKISGQYTTLIVLHKDAPGTIASVTEEMSRRGVNICNFRLARAFKGGTAIMTIEVDGTLEADLQERIAKLPNVLNCTLLTPM